MSSPLSTEDLVNVVRHHYDSSNDWHFTPEVSPEENRRQALWSSWIENLEPWKAFTATLSNELSNYVIGGTYSSSDGGPRCIVYPLKNSRTPSSNWLVVGCLSLLAPVCFVYGVERDYSDEGRVRRSKARFEPPPSHMSFPAQVVARTIEESFGSRAISREIAETPVHLFAGSLAPPKTTLFHTLFTNDPDTVP